MFPSWYYPTLMFCCVAGVTFLETESGETIRVDVSGLGSADKKWIESKWKK